MENISPLIPFVRYDRWGRRRVMRRFIWGLGGIMLGFMLGKFMPDSVPTATGAQVAVSKPAYLSNTPPVELQIDSGIADKPAPQN